MAFLLYTTENPIDREQRKRINENWEIITTRFSNVQNQISILSGGQDVEALLQRISASITNAETATTNANKAVDDANEAIISLGAESVKAKEATEAAITATTNAEAATTQIQALIAELDEKLPQLNTALQQNSTLKTELESLQSDLTQLKTQLDAEVVNAKAATLAANTAAQAIKGWGTATEWSASTNYIKNNVATFNRSTWQAKRDNRAVQPVAGDDWILLAGAGVDGTGAVSSVNGIMPDENGDVKVEFLTQLELEQHKTDVAPHQYGNKIEWRWNATTNSLDLVVL